MKTSQVGLIGLGAMGHGMAQSLRRAGHAPHVFDVRADVARAFARDGGTACTTLAELGAACNVVVSVVVNAAQTETVLFGPNGDGNGCADAMKPGSVFVMCSTVNPEWSMALEARLARQGILYIDAPISGGAAKAASGQITMMTAGTPAAYAVAEPLAGLMEQKVDEGSKELQCIKTTLLASMQGYAPQVAIEFGRKVLYSSDRPSFIELESHVKGKKPA